MSASWCKVASNLDSHPKIRRAGRLGREVFLFALRRNAEPNNPAPGKVSKAQLEPWYIGDQLMMPEPDAEAGLRACERAGLLLEEPTCWVIVGWCEREWGRLAKPGAVRTAEWRERKASNVRDENVTRGDARDACDAGEERRSEEKRGDQTRGEESEGFVLDFTPPPAAAPPPAKPKARRKASQMPEGWMPEPYTVPPNVDPKLELARFRDWAAAKAATFVDWNAAWRNWIRKAAEFASARAPAKQSHQGRMDKLIAIAQGGES